MSVRGRLLLAASGLLCVAVCQAAPDFAGAPASDDVFIRTLGTDGGNVCDNPSSALGKATLLDAMFNGADFVGRRPVVVDRRLIQGQLLIMETYCPDKLQDFKDDFQDLKFDDVIND